MALSDLFSNFHLLVRWLHVLAGITWIGHLYFFNFVNVPLQGALDDAGKKAVNPQLMPRALWWFRWGAMITLLAGLVLFVMNYMYSPGLGFGPTPLWSDYDGITDRALWISVGMLLGFIMWFNVWMIIWPAQKRILGLCGVAKATPEEAAPIRKKAALTSRINTYLSGPMLFAMLAPAHYGAFNAVTLGVASLLGLAAIWWSIRSSHNVGKSA
jgi:uncharacterized membrane protein